MSRASRQSLALLAIVHGIWCTIDSYNLAPELAPTVQYGKEVSEKVVIEFPESGDPVKNRKWIEDRVEEVDRVLNGSDEEYELATLSSIMLHILSDLYSVIKDKKKVELLNLDFEAADGFNEQIDPYGDQFKYYDKADKLVAKIYRILEFSV